MHFLLQRLLFRYREHSKKLITLLLCMLLLAAAETQADSPLSNTKSLSDLPAWQAQWSQCTAEHKCIVVAYGPGCYFLGAINDSYAVAVEEFLTAMFEEDCSLSLWDRFFRSVGCREQRCELR